MSEHFGRSFTGTRLEDGCPCKKAACGLVERVSDECNQHPMKFARTIRQSHRAQDCPKLPRVLRAEIEHATEDYFTALDTIALKHGLKSDEWLKHIDGDGSGEAYEEWVQETWDFDA